MKRRNFLTLVAAGSGGMLYPSKKIFGNGKENYSKDVDSQISADIFIAGGGLGGCAAALAACRNGKKVIISEETDWIGGQLSQQGVPPDEHPWIEKYGAPASYREFRRRVREFYKRNYPLTDDARKRKNINPGDGAVSRLCHEPKVAVAVLLEMMIPYFSKGNLILLLEHKVAKVDMQGDRVRAVQIENLRKNKNVVVNASYFIDATECGDLLPLSGTEYVTGTESKNKTRELHAPEKGDPENNQAFTLCFAMDYQSGRDNTIEKPDDYNFWRNYIPKMDPSWAGKLLELNYSYPRDLKPKEMGFHPEGILLGDMLNLWNYRRIINKSNFVKGTYDGDITIVNWPQNDYFPGNIIDVDDKEFKKHVDAARQLNLSLLYWLQTDVPRPDGGCGWPGLRLRRDIMGTDDGMAKYPYIRESRRIKSLFTILEEHVGAENRKMVAGDIEGKKAADFFDSVGIGYYHIDLHPTCKGDNYIDFNSLPYQIPMGALLPERVENLLPANKNIGTTHITNGCYRLHPTEWGIGEAVGLLMVYSLRKKIIPKAVRENDTLLKEFQEWIQKQGVEIKWPQN